MWNNLFCKRQRWRLDSYEHMTFQEQALLFHSNFNADYMSDTPERPWHKSHLAATWPPMASRGSAYNFQPHTDRKARENECSFNVLFKNWIINEVVEVGVLVGGTLVGTLTSHIRVPGFNPWLWLPTPFLLIQTLGGSSTWISATHVGDQTEFSGPGFRLCSHLGEKKKARRWTDFHSLPFSQINPF